MINEDLLDKLIQRVEEINKSFPQNKETAESLFEKILKKYLANQETKKEKTEGIIWFDFIKKNKRNMWRKAKHKCFYCQRNIPYRLCTIDHKIPVSRGGSLLNTNNMIISCKWCNQDKGILNDNEYFYKQLHNSANGIYPS